MARRDYEPKDGTNLFGAGALKDAAKKLFGAKQQKKKQMRDLEKELNPKDKKRGYSNY